MTLTVSSRDYLLHFQASLPGSCRTRYHVNGSEILPDKVFEFSRDSGYLYYGALEYHYVYDEEGFDSDPGLGTSCEGIVDFHSALGCLEPWVSYADGAGLGRSVRSLYGAVSPYLSENPDELSAIYLDGELLIAYSLNGSTHLVEGSTWLL